jgi:hypothetical protein
VFLSSKPISFKNNLEFFFEFHGVIGSCHVIAESFISFMLVMLWCLSLATTLNGSIRSVAPVYPINIYFVGLAKVTSCSHLISLASPWQAIACSRIHRPYGLISILTCAPHSPPPTIIIKKIHNNFHHSIYFPCVFFPTGKKPPVHSLWVSGTTM